MAITVKPGLAETRASPPSSGTISCFSLRIDTSVSWISGGQRVISSNRTTRPACIAW